MVKFLEAGAELVDFGDLGVAVPFYLLVLPFEQSSFFLLVYVAEIASLVLRRN